MSTSAAAAQQIGLQQGTVESISKTSIIVKLADVQTTLVGPKVEEFASSVKLGDVIEFEALIPEKWGDPLNVQVIQKLGKTGKTASSKSGRSPAAQPMQQKEFY